MLRCMVFPSACAHFPSSAIHLATRRLCEVVHTCLAWGTEMVGGGRSEEIVGEIGMRGLAKQPPDAAASHHHEQNRQCNCRCKHCNYCCERKDVHNAIRKCEKHVFPLDVKSPSRW